MIPADAPRSVLLRFPNWIGDVFMALPVLDMARELWPEAEIGVQVHDRARSILEGHREVARLHPVPGGGGIGWTGVIDGIGGGRYDLGILLTASFSSAWSFFLAGIPRRVGWAGEGRRALLTRSIGRPDRRTPLVSQYQSILRHLGYEGPSRRMGYLPPEAAFARAREWLAARHAGRDLVAVAPAASYGPAKRWPEPAYRELTRRLAEEHGLAVVVLGSGVEESTLAAVRGDSRHVFSSAGELDLPAAAALMSGCRLMVGNDTGLLQMARAVGTPVVGLFGSTSPAWTGPEPDEGEVVTLALSCSPCFRRECPLPADRLACLTEMTVDQVEGAALRLLQRDRVRT
jgi:heptosyltransferase-2